jgi:hypothetical protein
MAEHKVDPELNPDLDTTVRPTSYDIHERVEKLRQAVLLLAKDVEVTPSVLSEIEELLKG